MNAQDKHNYLLISDFDNTQVPTHSQLVQPDQSLPYSFVFKDMVENGEIPLIHCSGRTLPNILRDIEHAQYSDFPGPHAAKAKAILAAVGTEAYVLNEETGEYEELQGLINPAAAEYFESQYMRLQKLLSEVDGLQLQELKNQSKYKMSAWKNPATKLSNEEIVTGLYAKLDEYGIEPEDLSITVSMQGKLAVDFTPEGATKGNAIQFIARYYNVPLSDVIFAGDSSNDTDGMAVKGINRILPNNAQDVLVKAVERIAENEKRPASYYIAPENRNCAEGLLHGLVHFGKLDAMPDIPAPLRSLARWKSNEDRLLLHPKTTQEEPVLAAPQLDM